MQINNEVVMNGDVFVVEETEAMLIAAWEGDCPTDVDIVRFIEMSDDGIGIVVTKLNEQDFLPYTIKKVGNIKEEFFNLFRKVLTK